MDTNSMFSLMDLIVVAAGAYMLYGYYLLQFKGIMKEGLVLSKNVDPKKCTDPEGFRKFMSPKLLVISLSAIVSGLIGLFQTYVMPINMVIYWGFYFLFIIILIWFTVSSKKAERLYFNK